MKKFSKKINFFLILFFISFNIFSYKSMFSFSKSNSFLYLQLNFIPDNYKISNNKNYDIPINIFFKGNSYTTRFSPVMGSQLMLIENNPKIEFSYYLLFVTELEPIIINEETTIVNGLKLTKNSSSKCYFITVSLGKKENGRISYEWNIKDINLPKGSIPENTIIFQVDPSVVRVENFDKSFTPVLPASNIVSNEIDYDSSKDQKDGVFQGLLFMPNIYVNNEKILQNYNSLTMTTVNIKNFHRESEKICS